MHCDLTCQPKQPTTNERTRLCRCLQECLLLCIFFPIWLPSHVSGHAGPRPGGSGLEAEEYIRLYWLPASFRTS